MSSPKKSGVHADPDTAILTRKDVEFFRGLARGETAEVTRKADEKSSRESRAEAARIRKERMLAMDEERRAKGAGVGGKSETDIAKEHKHEADMSLARQKLDEGIDEVKFMNQVMLYSQCVTVRDAQVLEKKAISMERAEEERKVDMMMELERLKALRMYEEREQKRIEDRKKGAAVIRAQIEEREQERLRKIELKQQDQEAMISHIEKMKQDDRLETIKKKDAAKRLMEDVALANAEQIRLKNRQREMEQEEERQIAAYLRDRDAREQAVADEQRRIKAEKELEIARLRAKQEKAQDKKAALDELRAKRAQEEYERNHRTQEQEAARRAAAINADLEHARRAQMSEKEELLAEQAQLEKDEFERIIAVHKMTEAAERAKQQQEQALRRKNADALAKQIAEVEENRKKSRRDFLEEGNKLKAEKREREAAIDAIRARKLAELEKLQVPKQYRAELLKKKAIEPLRPTM